MQDAASILKEKKILIIDDDQFSILLARLKLRSYIDDDDIVAKTSVSDAIEYLDDIIIRRPAMIPNLILLETSMNRAEGWNFINLFSEWGRKINHPAKLVILTSSQFFSDYRRATKFENISGFLIKPLQTESLLELLRSHEDIVSSDNTLVMYPLVN